LTHAVFNITTTNTQVDWLSELTTDYHFQYPNSGIIIMLMIFMLEH